MRILSRIYNRLFGKSEYSSWSRNNDFRHNGGFVQFLPAIIAGASAIGGAISGNKAAKQAEEAAKASQVDIDSLDAKTRAIAKQNAYESAALERELTPEVPELRRTANEAVLAGLGDQTMKDSKSYLENFTWGELPGTKVGAAVSPLLRAAIAKAKANLDLGGALDKETQNAVTRTALAKAGTVGGGLGLGRDITARDIGLTSVQLANQRMQEAAQLGQLEQGLNQAGVDTAFRQAEEDRNVAGFNASNILSKIQLLQAINDSGFNKNIAAAQYGQSIAQPTVGLDPGSIADVISQNATNKSAALSNKANIYGQQSQGLLGMAGQMAGYGLMNYKPASGINKYGGSSASGGYGPF